MGGICIAQRARGGTRMSTRPGFHDSAALPGVIQAAISNIARIVTGTEAQDMELLVNQARAVGEYLKTQDLTSSQIRNVFGTVRNIESSWRVPVIVGQEKDPEAARRKAEEQKAERT